MKAGRREMALIFLGGIFFIAILYYLVILSPALTRQRILVTYIEKKEKELAGMAELKAKRERFKDRRTQAEKMLTGRGKAFTLLSFLEGVSREVGINDRIQYMKPLRFQEKSGPLRPAGIEMSLDKIDIKQLADLLYKIEYSGKLLNVKRIKIQCTPHRKARYLKVTLQINTYIFSKYTGV